MKKLIQELQLLAADMVCGKNQERIYQRIKTIRSISPWKRREYWKCKVAIFILKNLYGQEEYRYAWYKGRLSLILKGEI